MTIPLTIADLLTVGGLGIVVGLIVQFLVKTFLKDNRVINLIAIGLGIVIAVLATWFGDGGLTGSRLVAALLLGLAAGVTASGGFEALVNTAGKLGAGSRSDEAYLSTAVADILSNKATHDLVVQVVKKELKLTP
jgi:hypothetical protein